MDVVAAISALFQIPPESIGARRDGLYDIEYDSEDHGDKPSPVAFRKMVAEGLAVRDHGDGRVDLEGDIYVVPRNIVDYVQLQMEATKDGVEFGAEGDTGK